MPVLTDSFEGVFGVGRGTIDHGPDPRDVGAPPTHWGTQRELILAWLREVGPPRRSGARLMLAQANMSVIEWQIARALIEECGLLEAYKWACGLAIFRAGPVSADVRRIIRNAIAAVLVADQLPSEILDRLTMPYVALFAPARPRSASPRALA